MSTTQGNSRMKLYPFFIAFLVFCMIPFKLYAETWRTITSGWLPKDIVAVGDAAWAVSEGGVLYTDVDMPDVVLYNIDQGFYNNNPTAIAYEENTDIVLIGYEDGGIDFVDPRSRKVKSQMRDFANDPLIFKINDIFAYDGVVFVATDQGLSKLVPASGQPNDRYRWVVQETYRGFGTWTRPQEVTRVTVFEGKVFVGSEKGVAWADVSLNLQDISNWHVFDMVEDFGVDDESPKIVTMTATSNELYVIIEGEALFRLEDNRFERVASGWLFGVTELNGTVYVGRTTALTKLENDQLVRVGGEEYGARFSNLDSNDGVVWGALYTNKYFYGGILQYKDEQVIIKHLNSPAGDKAQVIRKIDKSIWVGARSSSFSGVFQFTEGNWIPYMQAGFSNGAFSRSVTIKDIEMAPDGAVWVGYRGYGLYVFDKNDAGEDTLRVIDEQNSVLRPSSEGGSYVLVNDFLKDDLGGMWVMNTEAHNDSCLIYIPSAWFARSWEQRSEVPWMSYRVPTDLIGKMAFDPQGRLWLVVTEQNAATAPVYMFNYKGTPTDRGDDNGIGKVSGATGSASFAQPNDIAMDDNGVLWIASATGLYYLDTNASVDDMTYRRVSGAMGEAINCIAIDPLNQLWLGTNFGVSVLGADRYTWVAHYTTDEGPHPSPLVNDVILSIGVDPISGDVYLGTDEGMSVVTTPYRDFEEDLGEIVVAPQPFVLDGSGVSLKFGRSSLTAGASAKIFTPSGKFIRELDFSEASVDGWDGRNEDGDWVASGVYLIVVTDKDGNSKVGKASVVRK